MDGTSAHWLPACSVQAHVHAQRRHKRARVLSVVCADARARTCAATAVAPCPRGARAADGLACVSVLFGFRVIINAVCLARLPRVPRACNRSFSLQLYLATL